MKKTFEFKTIEYDNVQYAGVEIEIIKDLFMLHQKNFISKLMLYLQTEATPISDLGRKHLHGGHNQDQRFHMHGAHRSNGERKGTYEPSKKQQGLQ